MTYTAKFLSSLRLVVIYFTAPEAFFEPDDAVLAVLLAIGPNGEDDAAATWGDEDGS